MSTTSAPVFFTCNRLLSQLPVGDYRRILPSLQPVCLTAQQKVYTKDLAVNSVYFPLDTAVSHIASMGNGSCLHVTSIGPEGMVGLPAFLGTERSRFSAFALVTGQALKMRASDLWRHTKQSPALLDLVQSYTERLLVQLALQVACSQMHPIKQRLICAFLNLQDSLGRAEFQMTQESLCQLLGVRRAGISEVASALQGAGLIRYSRGKLLIVDRRRLEASACECYGVLQTEHERCTLRAHG